MTVGLRIKQRRQQLGLTQADLSLLADISQTMISKYEAAQHEPAAHALFQLAKALDTSTDWLLGLTNEVNEVGGHQDLSELERQVVHIMRSKSPDQQKKLLEIARLL